MLFRSFSGQYGTDAGDMRQQWHTGCIQIDADGIDTGFHFAVERFFQEGLIDVVLLLPDADGSWVDFDEFGKGVLEAVSDTDGTANGDIQIRVFGDGSFAGGVHRGTGFADGDVGDTEVVSFEHVGDESISFT